jgi:hypothetical protein
MQRISILPLVFTLCLGGQAAAQQVAPPSGLANDLCSCIGTIDPHSDDRTFNLAVRHCLNTAMMQNSKEVVELMRKFPAEDRKFYVLGLVLGSSLDRSCAQYPLVKERMRTLLQRPPEASPNT